MAVEPCQDTTQEAWSILADSNDCAQVVNWMQLCHIVCYITKSRCRMALRTRKRAVFSCLARRREGKGWWQADFFLLPLHHRLHLGPFILAAYSHTLHTHRRGIFFLTTNSASLFLIENYRLHLCLAVHPVSSAHLTSFVDRKLRSRSREQFPVWRRMLNEECADRREIEESREEDNLLMLLPPSPETLSSLSIAEPAGLAWVTKLKKRERGCWWVAADQFDGQLLATFLHRSVYEVTVKSRLLPSPYLDSNSTVYCLGESPSGQCDFMRMSNNVFQNYLSYPRNVIPQTSWSMIEWRLKVKLRLRWAKKSGKEREEGERERRGPTFLSTSVEFAV